MPDYLTLYIKIFAALADEIDDLEKRLQTLKQLHQECEEAFLSIPEENNIYVLPTSGERDGQGDRQKC